MTVRTKTRGSAKGRKMSPGRPGLKTISVDAEYSRVETVVRPDKLKETPTAKRDAFTRYMSEVGVRSGLLTPTEEFKLATEIRKRLASAVRALKKELPASEKHRDWEPQKHGSKRSARTAALRSTLLKFNPSGLKGKELAAYIDSQSKGDLGLAMLAWHDQESYRVASRFIHANLRLVITLAKRYAFHGYMPLEDLIQEGNAGLVTAMLRYDPSRGFRFSTYGSWWIRHALGRAAADKGRMIRLPVHMIDFAQKVNRARRELIDKLERLPSEDEVAELMGCEVEKIRTLRIGLNEPVSLDVPVSEDHEESFGSIISSEPEEVSQWATLIPEKEQELIRAAIDGLTPVEKDILRLRFGLDDDETLTLREIGDKFSLSRERIRQIQERGLEKLRRRLTRDFAATI